MKKVIKFINMRGYSILEQLKYEELLLRQTNNNYFIFNYGHKTPSIIIGYSGKIKELVEVKSVARDNIPMIRRFTGGGTVIIDKNTIFATFIMNSDDIKCLAYPRNIMDWSEKSIYSHVFSGVATDHNLKFSLREHDYVFGDLKFGGNAQSITKNRWVHHTSFLWDFESSRMKYLQMPKRRPDYRGDRDHKEFLTTLKTYISSVNEFEQLILKQLIMEFDVEIVDVKDLISHINDNVLNGKVIESYSKSKYENIENYIEDDLE